MDAPDISLRAADLLAGPRGRRLLLEFGCDVADNALGSAVHEVSADLDPQRDRIARYVRYTDEPGDTAGASAPATPDTFARLLTVAAGRIPLPDPTAGQLRDALGTSVDAARYWCPSDGADVLTADPAVRAALTPWAEHLAASPLTDWWWSAPDPADQWTVAWGEDAAPCPAMTAEKRISNLRAWCTRTGESEQRDSGFLDRRRSVTAAAGGDWWSVPLWEVPASTRAWPDGTGGGDPVGALFVEERWEDAFCATRFTPPEHARIREITGADDWSALCREFPLEVTWSRRREWWEVTGRDSRDAGPWLIPDWSAVADRWDAVHLTVAGYLNAATRSIPVPGADGQDAASVIAGWGPDVTYWLR